MVKQQQPDNTEQLQDSASHNHARGRDDASHAGVDMVSWVMYLAAFLVSAFGVFVVSQYVLSRPAAQVLIKENELTTQQQRHIAQVITDQVVGNFFTADIVSLRNQVASIDWVKDVRIVRQWPNGLAVNAVARHPIARFGSERFISQDGTVFNQLQLQQATDLPMMYGPKHKTADMMQQYRQVNDWFREANMSLDEVSLTDRMTWFFKFDNGMRVIVDRDNTQAKLYRLSVLSRAQLQPVWSRIDAVDLRYRNGMAVLWKDNKKPAEFTQARLNAF